MPIEPKPLSPTYKKPIRRLSGPAASESDQQDTTPAAAEPMNGQAGPDDVESGPAGDAGELTPEQAAELEKRRGVIESRMCDDIREAIGGRTMSGIEEVWRESDDLYNGVDERTAPESTVKTRDQVRAAAGGSARSKVVLNITAPKTDTGVARVQEMLVPTDDKPWGLDPSPVPDIDKAAEDSITGQQVQLADGTTADRATVAQMVKDKAREACEEEADWIEDRFVEGKVYSELRDVIQTAGRLGTGVLKGPTPVEFKDRRWDFEGTGDQAVATLQIKQRISPSSFSINPENCFPDPACGDDIQRGNYFAEREFMTARLVRKLQNLPGYNRDAIAQALHEGPMSAAQWRAGTETSRRKEGDARRDSSQFEVFYYYGFLQPADMLLLGVPIEQFSAEDLELAAIPVVATMLNGRCIKASINPLESGEFPYSFFRWHKVKGQPWGRGIPWKMRTAQKALTASVRALLENAGLTAGPQIAFIKGALEPVNGQYEIVGRKLWEFDATDSVDDIRKAFAVFNIESRQQELLELVQFWLNMADQLTNLPMLLQGEQAAGTSPETLGGMKMLVNNASSPLRTIAKAFDDDVIIDHLPRYHEWYMGDPEVKSPLKRFCDTRVQARGSTVLVQREEAREFLMMLFAVKDDPDLRLNPAKFARELARANGFPIDTIQYTEDEWKQELQRRSQQPPPEDPRITAAKLRNEGIAAQVKSAEQRTQMQVESDRENNAEERALKKFLAQFDLQIEEMRLAGQQSISLSDIKAMLAGKAMDNRMKSEEMQLKLSPANPMHTGI